MFTGSILKSIPTPLKILLPGLLLCCGIGHAHQAYLTTLNLRSPVTSQRIDRVQFLWCTDSEGRNVGRGELEHYAVFLFSGNDLVYSNKIIYNNTLLPLTAKGGGFILRTRKDLFWQFDQNRMILRQMANTSPHLFTATSGVHYTVTDNKSLPSDGHVRIRRIVNGEVLELEVGHLASQSTRQVFARTFTERD
jgi:hypothetical protein